MAEDLLTSLPPEVVQAILRAPTVERLLRIEQVMEMTGLSSSTIYKWQAEDRFPRAVLLGVRASRWVGSEVAAWVEQQRKEGQRATFRPVPKPPEVAGGPAPPVPPRRGRGRPRKA